MDETLIVRWYKTPKDWQAKLLNLMADCKDLLTVIKRISEDRETRELNALSGRITAAPSPTANSSVPTPGHAEKQSRSGSVSQVEIGTPTLMAIMEGSKSTKSTLPALVEFWEDSSTLKLTLRWPTPSGSNQDGNLGPAAPTRYMSRTKH